MAHEDLNRTQLVEGSSNRTFGLVFAGVFLVITAWPLFHGEALRGWASAIAAAFALVALAKPTLLTRPNQLWMKLGIVLGKVVNPIALGILFYGVFTPIGAAMRLTGKDSLRLKFNPNADSYWILRDPPGPPPDSMTNQF